MEKTNAKTYSINDFREWHKAGTLNLTPKFQRRSVWSAKARSYFIDTILRNLPTPKIFMRQYLDDVGQTIREIVDGQQRIATILSYYQNGFPDMHVHGRKEFGGKYYNDLPKESKDSFLNYELSVEVLIGATDADVLDVFARLNTYGVRLNKQELLNAKYFGYFKQTAYRLAFEYYGFWVDNGIFTETGIARMLEAELASELVIAMISGMQSRKVVENYYKKYDDVFNEEPLVVDRFKSCIDLIGAITENRLQMSDFKSSHLFYSLFCVICDLKYGLPNSTTKKIEFDKTAIARVRSALWDIDELFEQEYELLKPDDLRFIEASTRRTTDLTARILRHNYLIGRAVKSVEA